MVANYQGNSLYLVDLTTGNRTLLSGATQGAGPALDQPVSLTLHPNGSLYTAGDFVTTIMKVDVTTGDRTPLPNPGAVFYTHIYGLAVNPAGNLIASSASLGSLYEIDVDTGVRTTLASLTVGSGAGVGFPGGFLVEGDGNIVYADFSTWRLVRLNTNTLVRTEISSLTVGTGPTYGRSGTVVRLANGDFAVSGYSFGGPGDWIIRVDPATGNRTVLTSPTVGTGPAIGRVFSLAIATDGSIYASDAGGNAILNVDPTTGNRTLISEASVGTGPAFDFPLGILPVAVASVATPEGAPWIDAATFQGAVGAAFNFQIVASNNPTSYAATGLPAGLSVNTATGWITGTPTQGGAFVATLSATNGAGTYSTPMYLTIAPAAQTITFGGLANKLTTDGPFSLTGSASSSLPVTYTIVSGPAMLSGSTVTLTGASGTVVIRADQTGNNSYTAGASVTRSFTVSAVGPQVYFGSLSAPSAASNTVQALATSDSLAGYISADGKGGSLVGYIAQSRQAFVYNFTVTSDGTLQGVANAYTGSASGSAAASVTAQSSDAWEVGVRATPLTIQARVADGVITGAIANPSLSFTASMQPQTGSWAPLSGYYVAPSLNTASGTSYAVLGTDGRVFAVAITPGIVAAGNSTVASNGTFSVADGSNTISGTINSVTTSLTGTLAGSGNVTVTFAGLKSTTVRTDRLVNLSSRAQVGEGERALFTGLVISGTAPKQILIRAIGSALTSAGVTGALADAELRLYQGSNVIAQNDNWADNSNATAITQAAQRVGAFSLAASPKEAALLVTLAPGVYGAQVTGHGASGVALAEIYDASENAQADYQRLVNISSRGFVSSGENVLIGGFIVTGNSPKRVLVRGVGPALARFGVAGVLNDPVLQVRQGGTLIARNDNWGTPASVGTSQTAASAAEILAAATTVGATALSTGSKDASLIVTLAPGVYSAVVSSADSSAGIALVEVYELVD